MVAMNTPCQNANDVAELVFASVEQRREQLRRHQRVSGFIQSMTTTALQADTARIMVPADLLDHQYGTLHVLLTPETEDPINKELLIKMMKGTTLINTARREVMHEAEMLELFSARPDFCCLSEVQRRSTEEVKALVGTRSRSASSSPRRRWAHRHWKH